MNIHSTAGRPLSSASRYQQAPPTEQKSGPFDQIKDTFLSTCNIAATALPGAVMGGLIGAGVGLNPGLFLVPAYGLAAPLISAGVMGAVGAVVGGFVSSDLARMD